MPSCLPYGAIPSPKILPVSPALTAVFAFSIIALVAGSSFNASLNFLISPSLINASLVVPCFFANSSILAVTTSLSLADNAVATSKRAL